MASGIDGGDFWLPADFPVADDLTAERRLKESDDEDYLADLTRRMALAFLHDDEVPHTKMHSMARSPQSTLCDYRIWNKGSSNLTSPPSQLSSPPAASFEQSHDDAWDLLTAAAGQVVRLRLAEEARRRKFNERGLLAPAGNISAPIAASPKRSAGTGVYYPPLLAQQQQLQVERFYQLKQQQVLKHQISLAASRQQIRSGCRPGVVPSSTPHRQPAPVPLMQHPRPGVGSRPVFLTGHGTRRESTGTGVFLPRRPENPSDLRKKPASPVRSIQSPKLNGDDMRSQPRVLGDFLDPESLVARGNRFLLQQHQHQNRYQHHAPAPAMADHEKLRLPAEWTY